MDGTYGRTLNSLIYAYFIENNMTGCATQLAQHDGRLLTAQEFEALDMSQLQSGTFLLEWFSIFHELWVMNNKTRLSNEQKFAQIAMKIKIGKEGIGIGPPRGQKRKADAVELAAYEAQLPVYEAQVPVHQQPTPLFEQPTPFFEQPTPFFEQPTPVFEQPTPVFEQPIPVFEHPALDFEQHAPVCQQPAPIFERQPPIYQQPAPPLRLTSPVDVSMLPRLPNGRLNLHLIDEDTIARFPDYTTRLSLLEQKGRMRLAEVRRLD